MPALDFLADDQSRSVIARLAKEVAKAWAPDQVDDADLVTELYLEEVQAAGRLQYLRRDREHALGFGGVEDLVLLLILPVLTGFLGNLLAVMSVSTFEGLRKKWASQPTDAFRPEALMSALEPQARAAGLNPKQIEQLTQLLAISLSAILTAGNSGGGQP
jgi:hypothetical protein